MTVRGDQKVESKSFYSSDLYLVLKAYEVLLLLAISAAEGHLVWKTDTSQASTRVDLKVEFMKKYYKDFPVTGGRLMMSCLGMQVEQGDKKIKLHPHHCVRETLTVYNG